MAYRLTGDTQTIADNLPLIEGMLACYDTIGDPDFDYDRDETLQERSAYEMVRDQLSAVQVAELDKIDAYWQAHPKEFNADFAVWHFQEDKNSALAGWVEDANGIVPPIPRSHWWWRPIENGAE